MSDHGSGVDEIGLLEQERQEQSRKADIETEGFQHEAECEQYFHGAHPFSTMTQN